MHRKRHAMGWTIFLLVVSGLYDVYALQLARRNGRHPVSVVYGFYVPSAELLTGMTIMQANFQRLPILSNPWMFALGFILLAAAVISVFVAGLLYRHTSPHP